MNITTAELLDAIAAERRPASQPADTFTRVQLQQAIGCGKDLALKHIHALVRAGRAVPTTIAMTDLIGRSVSVPGYRLLRSKRPAR